MAVALQASAEDASLERLGKAGNADADEDHRCVTGLRVSPVTDARGRHSIYFFFAAEG